MATRKFVVVDRDYCAFRFMEQILREEFSEPETEQVVVRSDEYGNDTLGLTKDGKVLWENERGDVDCPALSEALRTIISVQRSARATLKQAKEDLRVCRKIRQALEETREFGHKTEAPGPFSGLLKRRDD